MRHRPDRERNQRMMPAGSSLRMLRPGPREQQRAAADLAGTPDDALPQPEISAGETPGHDDAAPWATPRIVEPGD
jgi:hypothetical protein